MRLCGSLGKRSPDLVTPLGRALQIPTVWQAVCGGRDAMSPYEADLLYPLGCQCSVTWTPHRTKDPPGDNELPEVSN